MTRRRRSRRVLVATAIAALVLDPVPTRAQLTSAGSQVWSQDSTGVASTPEIQDGFGRAVASGDFDGDGFVDLAVGVPGEDLLGMEGAGAVHVVYGTNQGLSGSRSQYWAQGGGQVPEVVEDYDSFGAALAVGDFNGDGRDDLAVGAPDETVDSASGAGAVIILYGDSNGLTDAGSQVWYQGHGGLAGAPELGDHFGRSLAAGDFNGDGRADLAIGSPLEALTAGLMVGLVQILHGSGSGLSAAASQFWHQDLANVPGTQQVAGLFGWALAAGDFDGDSRDDLAIGSPGTKVTNSLGTWTLAGAVTILYGSSPAGLVTGGAWHFHRETPLILGGAYEADGFGGALAAGDFDGDDYDDLAIGAPGDDWGAPSSGSVNVVYGSQRGLVIAGNQIWHQDLALLDDDEDGDSFGSSLATADFDRDGYDDLAVGVPGEWVGSQGGAGAVQVIYGTNFGLNASGNQLWTQDSALYEPVPGVAESEDALGWSLAAGDFDGDGDPDLAIGVPTEDIGAVDAGAVNVLYASTFRSLP